MSKNQNWRMKWKSLKMTDSITFNFSRVCDVFKQTNFLSQDSCSKQAGWLDDGLKWSNYEAGQKYGGKKNLSSQRFRIGQIRVPGPAIPPKGWPGKYANTNELAHSAARGGGGQGGWALSFGLFPCINVFFLPAASNSSTRGYSFILCPISRCRMEST